MPLHYYVCGTCGKEDQALTMAAQEAPPAVLCSECNDQPMDRDYSPRIARTGAAYSNPILSDGLGVMPNQVSQARKLHPDREYLPDGRLVMRSHADRNRYLKEDGFHDNN
jgi:hypothetical protein